MDREETFDFNRGAATFLIDALLLVFLALMFVLGLGRSYPLGAIVAFIAAVWQVLFTMWVLMYPYARLEGGRITFYARYQQRKSFLLKNVAGVVRNGNDIEITLKEGEPLSFSLFWMKPAQRDLLIRTLQP